MVSKASDDLPEPLKPVITVKRVARDLDVDVLQVMLARAVNGDAVQHDEGWRQTAKFPFSQEL